MRSSKFVAMTFSYFFAILLLPFISYKILSVSFNLTDELSIVVYANLISYIFLTVIALILFGGYLVEDFKKIESIGKFLKGTLIGWGLLLLALLVSNLLLILITGELDSSQNQQIVEETLGAYPILMAITTVLFAPLVEEIIFRLMLMKKIILHPWFSILFSSFLFAIIHVIQAGDFIFMIPYMAMGIPLGYSYYKTGNICYPIGIHLLQNLFSTIAITFI